MKRILEKMKDNFNNILRFCFYVAFAVFLLLGCKSRKVEKIGNLDLGDQKFIEGKFEDAFSYYNAAIQNGEKVDKAYLGRGNVYTNWRRFDEAISDYTISLRYKQSAEALSGRCNAYRLLGKFDQAMKDCNEATSLDPNSLEAAISLSLLYLEQDDPSKAEIILQDALQKNMQSPEIYYVFYQLEMKHGNYAKALGFISKSIEYDPNQASYYCERGSLYYALAKMDQAKLDFKKASDIAIEGKDDECLFKAQSFLQLFGGSTP